MEQYLDEEETKNAAVARCAGKSSTPHKLTRRRSLNGSLVWFNITVDEVAWYRLILKETNKQTNYVRDFHPITQKIRHSINKNYKRLATPCIGTAGPAGGDTAVSSPINAP